MPHLCRLELQLYVIELETRQRSEVFDNGHVTLVEPMHLAPIKDREGERNPSRRL